MERTRWIEQHSIEPDGFDVAIMMGSKSDLPAMKPAAEILRKLGLKVTMRVLSAHRTPEQAAAFVREATRRRHQGVHLRRRRRGPPGGRGGRAHHPAGDRLPIASGSLQGFDSLLSTVMMPPGMPVATVAVGGAENAGLLAAQIIALARSPALGERVLAEREARRAKVLESDAEVRAL